MAGGASGTGEKIGTRGGVLLLLNVIIALGILTMPYQFRLAGWMTILVMCFVGGVAMFTAFLIYRAIALVAPLADSQKIPLHSRDWGYLASVAFGSPGRVAAEVCFIGELLAYILSFLCTLGVHLHLLMPALKTTDWMIVSSVAVFFMSYIPPGFLSKVALFSHSAYAVVVLCLLRAGHANLQHPSAPALAEIIERNWQHMWTVKALPHLPTVALVCTYSWAGHATVPTIAGQLKTPENIKFVVFISFPIAVGVALLIGLLGYYIFGPETQQVFTENIGKVYWVNPDGDLLEGLSWLRLVAAISVTIKLAATIPCLLYPILVSTEQNIRAPTVRALWRAFLLMVLGLAACKFEDEVVIAVALAGATFGNVLVFILPCLVYYGIKRQLNKKVGVGEAAVVLFVVLLGVAQGVFGVYDSLQQLGGGQGGGTAESIGEAKAWGDLVKRLEMDRRFQ